VLYMKSRVLTSVSKPRGDLFLDSWYEHRNGQRDLSKDGKKMSTHPSLKSRTAIRGSIPSKKCSLHMVHYQGMLTRAYVYLLEYDDSVQSYQERPFSIPYSSGSLRSQYTPDFRVQWHHQRPRLVACMPEMTASTVILVFALHHFGEHFAAVFSAAQNISPHWRPV
jgi:hypothetical protein